MDLTVRSEVGRLLGEALTRELERSLWLHRALLGVCCPIPKPRSVRPRKNIARRGVGQRPDGRAMRYLDEWIRVLDSGLDDAVDVLTSSSKSASELRQNSPFAGLLDEMRVQVLHAFNEHWRCAHEDTHVRSAG